MFCIVVINKQKYCFERKNRIVSKPKKIVLSLLYYFSVRESQISLKILTGKKALSNIVLALTKSTNMAIRTVGKTNQLFMRGG